MTADEYLPCDKCGQSIDAHVGIGLPCPEVRTSKTVTALLMAARSSLRQARCPECSRNGMQGGSGCNWCRERAALMDGILSLPDETKATQYGRFSQGTKVLLLGSLLPGMPNDGWVVENIDEPRPLKYRIRHANGSLIDVLPELIALDTRCAVGDFLRELDAAESSEKTGCDHELAAGEVCPICNPVAQP